MPERGQGDFMWHNGSLLPASAEEMGRKNEDQLKEYVITEGLFCMNQMTIYRSPLSWPKMPFLHLQWNKKISVKFFSIEKYFSKSST